MPQTTTRTIRAVMGNHVITQATFEAEQLLALNPDALDHLGMRRGDEVTFETVDVTVTTELTKEYRYGYTGQTVERIKTRTEQVVATDTRKLWKTKGRGWYWKTA